ncbi:MAG TPA: hypothetical protein VGJ05_16750 [Fimbriiglobus sp.]
MPTPHRTEARDPGGRSVAELLVAYVGHAVGHYCTPDGRPTSELFTIKLVVRTLREMYGDLPVAKFGPQRLKASGRRGSPPA